ncbi:helix-turn-helix transcriptional regulator [Mesorhizobium sp. YR577]|jgi:DNA-binding XRE family transcriptional regulator|uniref:helix-turn-helix domain-containing protein n=1 Tax=Mesorhizobium sp. YR577 TaxID=1884373 RepID=UPI0008F02093|nr:helix-turn-helix transcriptional regulator [Mesorhizobium sp. YR577]SFT85568.1 transcriptional regulator, XRE family [Mesorhizobium sp. YR577]
MNAPQIIKTPGGEELVVLPKADYDALLRAADEAAEDAADAAIYDARKAELSGTEPFPAELSMAILRGDSRLKALRKWRGLTQSDLADKAGLTQGFLSDLEGRRRTASDDTAARLAAALAVPAAWIEG